MAQNVNVKFTPLIKGTKVQVDRWTCTETITWQDDNGAPHSWTGTLTYPDDLALMTLTWQKDQLLRLMYEGSRVGLGLDT
jgi:hypothetical protein